LDDYFLKSITNLFSQKKGILYFDYEGLLLWKNSNFLFDDLILFNKNFKYMDILSKFASTNGLESNCVIKVIIDEKEMDMEIYIKKFCFNLKPHSYLMIFNINFFIL
jgi:hypothetical protein